jgi:hypothetical protein
MLADQLSETVLQEFTLIEGSAQRCLLWLLLVVLLLKVLSPWVLQTVLLLQLRLGFVPRLGACCTAAWLHLNLDCDLFEIQQIRCARHAPACTWLQPRVSRWQHLGLIHPMCCSCLEPMYVKPRLVAWQHTTANTASGGAVSCFRRISAVKAYLQFFRCTGAR